MNLEKMNIQNQGLGQIIIINPCNLFLMNVPDNSTLYRHRKSKTIYLNALKDYKI